MILVEKTREIISKYGKYIKQLRYAHGILFIHNFVLGIIVNYLGAKNMHSNTHALWSAIWLLTVFNVPWQWHFQILRASVSYHEDFQPVWYTVIYGERLCAFGYQRDKSDEVAKALFRDLCSASWTMKFELYKSKTQYQLLASLCWGLLQIPCMAYGGQWVKMSKPDIDGLVANQHLTHTKPKWSGQFESFGAWY